MANNPNKYNEQVGLLRRGWIDSYNSTTNTINVKLNNSPITSNNPPHSVPLPHSLFNNNGLFIGTLPAAGTPIVVGQGSGGQFYFVSFLAENLSIVPDLTLGTLLLQSNDRTKITLDTNYNIQIGSNADRIHLNTNSHFISSNIDNEYSFTQASRKINGVVKRDLVINTNFDRTSKLENDNYDQYYYVIPMDPTTTPTSVITGSNKNPPFIEQREIVYEFQYDSSIEDDLSESLLYGTSGGGNTGKKPPTLNRRTSRADTLSLTLASPNYLMETVKGTVIDIFANILDLNRNPLPIGKDQATLRADQSNDKIKSFLTIKELERKSIAYHFEINARKDLTGKNGQISLPDITSNADHARSRSRFFLDIDKEGQLKLNVPASSETGNVPLLLRYENYSTFSKDDNGNPNQLTFRDDNLDIFQDSFAANLSTITNNGFNFADDKGSIQLKNGDLDGAPLDRITNLHIKHGTAYHDILQTCYAHQDSSYINYQSGTAALSIDIAQFPLLTDLVSTTINIAGQTANAGGRSGSCNFDGSLDLNIGANTVDRQSLWIDTAGGMVANFGRDRNGRSALLSMNGDLFLQVGGFGVVGDLRFDTQFNQSKGAILDLRIMTSGGFCHMIRCDNNGITIMTPSNISIHSAQNINITADHDINIESETMTIQGRGVLKGTGGSI